MEKKKGMTPYIICIAVVAAAMGLYVFRLFDWQIIQGAEMVKIADRSSQYAVPMNAARGEILDRNGTPLAVNKTCYAIVCDAMYMNDNSQRNRTILTLLELLKKSGEAWEDSLPITVDAGGVYSFSSGEEKEIETLKSADYAHVNPYATAEECMNALVLKYGAQGYDAQTTRGLVAVRYGMTRAGFSPERPYIFAADISLNTLAIIRENADMLPGISGEVTTARQYPLPELMPHSLGAVGPLSKEEYEEKRDGGYAYDDRIGKSGVEKAFEDALRGKNGEKTVETDPKGDLAGSSVKKAPVQGSTVYLTLDRRLQAVGNASLAKNLAATRANGEQIVKLKGTTGHGEDSFVGGAAVIELETGGLLAASSWPGYDQTKLADQLYLDELNADPTKPLLNHALYGTFSPGSSFKPAVALGALEEGVITSTTPISCIGRYMRFSDVGYTPKCLGVHGAIPLEIGLARSCNVFFFETGYRLGIDSMNLYCTQLGLGQPTGLEISESAGVLAGPKHSTALGSQWNYAGGTIQAAIGQSDNSFTTAQLATYVGTIANNGTRLRTHIEQRITDYTRKTVTHQFEPQAEEKLTVSQANIDFVKAGMRAVVALPQGSAHAGFGSYPIEIAAKTGTAEWAKGSDNVTFIAYAPAENPRIALAVVLEHGATGTYCQAVAKDLLDAYFFGKDVDKYGNIVMPSAG